MVVLKVHYATESLRCLFFPFGIQQVNCAPLVLMPALDQTLGRQKASIRFYEIPMLGELQ